VGEERRGEERRGEEIGGGFATGTPKLVLMSREVNILKPKRFLRRFMRFSSLKFPLYYNHM
jgi:hypothetical protein